MLREMAEEIVRETMTRLNRNINIMDSRGIIIASGDSKRINQLHEGALEVIKTGNPLIITIENMDKYNGALPGINLPIEFQGKVVGVIGITGELNEVKEFGGLVKMTTEMMMKQTYLTTQSEWEQRVAEMIIEELIQPQPSLEFIEQRLDVLSIKLQNPLYTIIVEMKERIIGNPKIIELVKDLFGPKHCLSCFLGVHRLFILTLGVEHSDLLNKIRKLSSQLNRLGIRAKLGISTQATSPDKVSLSYHEAELALFVEQGEMTFYSEIEAKALIYQLEDAVKQSYLTLFFFVILSSIQTAIWRATASPKSWGS